MSNALAIAGVTAVLKDLLDGGMIDHNLTSTMGSGVIVSAVAPDSIDLENDSTRRLNLFLHQVTPNAAWRNVGYPARNAAGERISNPPLALDLHYLLTAYGTLDLEAEVLLGFAMQVLHETPVLARAAIRKALNPPSPPVTGSLLPNVFQALQASELADQIEQIKITPSVMNTEELSKLWTAFQAHYRPTAPYQVTVVLIESRKPRCVRRCRFCRATSTRAPTLVPPYPEIESIELPKSQLAAQLGEPLKVHGHDLDGASHALILTNDRQDVEQTLTLPTAAGPSQVTFTLPDEPQNYPAGTYTATLRLVHGIDPLPRLTNQLSLSIAPEVTVPSTVHIDANGDLTLTPTCKPELRPTQRISLILGGHEVLAEPVPTRTSTPTFIFKKLPPAKYWVRLRVDGVDSRLIDFEASPASVHRSADRGEAMTDAGAASWVEANQRCLAVELARLRRRIEGGSGGRRSRAGRERRGHGGAAGDRSRRQRVRSVALRARRAAAVRRRRNGRTVRAACLQANGGRGATFALALGALDEPHWSALTLARPLRRWRLIEIEPNQALTTATLRIDERVLHFLAGINLLDARLQPLSAPARHRR